MSDKKKYSELVLKEREKGNVVFIAIDEFRSAPVKDIVAQPVDGLLWDLNRDEATALTFMDREGMIHWVNNFAVALVVRELKSQLTQLEAENDALRDKVWKALAPYIASEDVEYGEDEMEHLCESVLPTLWSSLLTGE